MSEILEFAKEQSFLFILIVGMLCLTVDNIIGNICRVVAKGKGE